MTAVREDRDDDVARNVFASVLNASVVLDVDSKSDAKFKFLKRSEETFSSDLQEIQRLSGAFNVTTGDGGIRGRGRKICAANSGAEVCIIYGVEERAASRYLYRQAHKSAVAAAWRREAARARLGVSLAKWTQSELTELARSGEVRGYTGIEVQNVHKVPALVGHGSNIVFVRDSELLKHQRKGF